MSGNTNSVITGTRLTDRDLIESIVENYFIADYGYISKVNDDKTVNVIHAVKPALQDGSVLSQTETKNIELLFISGSGFSITWDVKANDRVLLVGLKDYVKSVDAVTAAADPGVYVHYSRATLKAVPLCIFNSDAKVTLEIKDGAVTFTASDTINVKSDKELNLTSSDTMALKSDKEIDLNGNSKQFVTWTELNTALQQMVTIINTHTHVASSLGSPTATPLPQVTLDISNAKTTTVKTGG